MPRIVRNRDAVDQRNAIAFDAPTSMAMASGHVPRVPAAEIATARTSGRTTSGSQNYLWPFRNKLDGSLSGRW